MQVGSGRVVDIPPGATWFQEYDPSAANTANTETVAAVAGKRHYLLGYRVCVSGDVVGADGVAVSVKDGSTEVGRDMIPASSVIGSSVNSEPGHPVFIGSLNTALNIVVGAGGSGVITHLSYYGYTL
jgi:hypothetical protein